MEDEIDQLRSAVEEWCREMLLLGIPTASDGLYVGMEEALVVWRVMGLYWWLLIVLRNFSLDKMS